VHTTTHVDVTYPQVALLTSCDALLSRPASKVGVGASQQLGDQRSNESCQLGPKTLVRLLNCLSSCLALPTTYRTSADTEHKAHRRLTADVQLHMHVHVATLMTHRWRCEHIHAAQPRDEGHAHRLRARVPVRQSQQQHWQHVGQCGPAGQCRLTSAAAAFARLQKTWCQQPRQTTTCSVWHVTRILAVCVNAPASICMQFSVTIRCKCQ
jgi:hypothetical protein